MNSSLHNNHLYNTTYEATCCFELCCCTCCCMPQIRPKLWFIRNRK